MTRRALAAAALLLSACAAQASLLAPSGQAAADRAALLADIRTLQPALAPQDAVAVEVQVRRASSLAELERVRDLTRLLVTGAVLELEPPQREDLRTARSTGLSLRARVGLEFNRGHWMNSPDGRVGKP